MAFNVYKITHRETGKSYIGVTMQKVRARWVRHCYDAIVPKTILGAAILQYGADAFYVVTVRQASSADEMYAAEQALIAECGTRHPLGFNMTSGGEGAAQLVAEVQTRKSAAIKANWAARATRKRSPEFCAKVAASWVKRKASGEDFSVSAEHAEKIAASKRGKPRDAATKAKLSAALIQYHATHSNAFAGKRHTPEARAKIAGRHAERRALRNSVAAQGALL